MGADHAMKPATTHQGTIFWSLFSDMTTYKSGRTVGHELRSASGGRPKNNKEGAKTPMALARLRAASRATSGLFVSAWAIVSSG